MSGQRVKQKEEFNKTEDLTEQEHGTKTGAEYGESAGTRTDIGEQHTTGGSEAKRTESGQTRTGSVGGLTGQTKGTTTTGGETQNIMGWGAEMPETEAIKGLRSSIEKIKAGDYVNDPGIPWREANAKKQALQLANNPVGPFQTPETTAALTRQLFSNIGQQAGQEYLTQAFNRGQQAAQAVGLEANLVNLMSPKYSLLGTKSTGTQASTQDTSQQTTQDTVSNTLSEMLGIDKTYADVFSKNLMQSLQQNFGVDFSEAQSEAEKHGVSSGSSTSTTSSPFNWGGLVSGLLGAVA